jgi:peptidoglycan/xylan/chitin deacetylase (PgdA/CDA1 family)
MRSITESSRVLSITFDDGFKQGSDIACDILARYNFAATFYLVTGWIEPTRVIIRDTVNADVSHGDWRHWRGVLERGHELGSHTFSHLNARGKAAYLFPWLVSIEFQKSLADLKREALQPSYTLSLPWNAASHRSRRVAPRYFSACRVGSQGRGYNRLANFDPFCLDSWAPNPATSIADYHEAIRNIPQGGWLVIQLHSIDGEGWEPISSATFDGICDFVSDQGDIEVATIREVIERLESTFARK